MSAIAGIFNRDGRAVTREELSVMTMALKASGERSETFWLAGNVGFGHRLSWFTKEDEFENQPLTGRDSTFTLIAVGRIDNRSELIETLRLSEGAASLPDSALMMAALEKWGEESLTHLAGSFAFAAFDSRNRTLLLARSPRGEHSLYYRAEGNRFEFASAPKAIFALGVPRQLNLQRVADHLVGMPPNPNSCSWYQGLISVEPGTALRVRSDGLKPIRFWRLDPGRRIRYARDSDYVEAFSELWQRIVTDHMRSRNGIGVLLSGGLDSTAIAAVAASSLSRTGRRLATYTEVPPASFSGSVPPGWYADETPYVRAMADKFPNIDLNFVTPENRFFLDGIEDYFEAAESPIQIGFNRLWAEAIFSGAARQQVPVLLDGQAGNLTISWSGGQLIPQLLGRGQWLRAYREARALVRTGIASSVPAALSANLLPFLPGPLWSALLRARYPDNPLYSRDPPWKTRALITPEFARERRVVERARECRYDFRFRHSRDFRSMTLGPAVGEGDTGRAIESRFGVQLRSPAADPRVVEFCLSIPEDQFLRNGVSRWLVKRALRDTVPEVILNNRLRGLQSATWLEKLGTGSSSLEDDLDRMDRSPLVRYTIDLPRLRSLIAQLREGTGTTVFGASFWGTRIGRSLTAARFLLWTETRN